MECIFKSIFATKYTWNSLLYLMNVITLDTSIYTIKDNQVQSSWVTIPQENTINNPLQT